MEQFYFRQLKVYQNAKQLAIEVHSVLRGFPREERFALVDQLNRASTSVAFNIAEGFGRYTVKDRVRFLDIANGSLMETISELELAKEFCYITPEQLLHFDALIAIIVRQLSNLRNTISEREHTKNMEEHK